MPCAQLMPCLQLDGRCTVVQICLDDECSGSAKLLEHGCLTGYAGHLNSSLLAEAITSCLEELSEPLVTAQLSGDLLAHLSAVSVGSVKMYVVKCLLEQLPELHYGKLLLRSLLDVDKVHCMRVLKSYPVLSLASCILNVTSAQEECLACITQSLWDHRRTLVTLRHTKDEMLCGRRHFLCDITHCRLCQMSCLYSMACTFVSGSSDLTARCPAAVLEALITLLAALRRHHAKNGMTATMLAQALGPLVLRPEQTPAAQDNMDLVVDGAVSSTNFLLCSCTWQCRWGHALCPKSAIFCMRHHESSKNWPSRDKKISS